MYIYMANVDGHRVVRYSPVPITFILVAGVAHLARLLRVLP